MKNILFFGLAVVMSMSGCIPLDLDGASSRPAGPYQTIFASAEHFPVPPNSMRIQKTIPVKGSGARILFYTKLSLEELREFYTSRLTALGCEERRNQSNSASHSLWIAFSCVKGYQDTHVNVVDMAYSSANDERMVVGTFQIPER